MDCLPIAEVGPRLGDGKAPLNTRVWIRLAPGNAYRFRRKGGAVSVAKLMRAVRLVDRSADKDMKFMLRVDSDAGADTVLSLRPMASFKPNQRYRVELALSENRTIQNEFETGARPTKAKNPARGEVVVDHRQSHWDSQTPRVRYRVESNETIAPLYQIFIAPVGTGRPKTPSAVEFSKKDETGWSVDVIAREACKGRYIPPGKRDIQAWLRPLTWYGSAMGPLVGPCRIPRNPPPVEK